MTRKILRLFVNTFTADDKYSVFNRDNLTQPIQMQLSEKKKPFLNFFPAVLKSRLNFEHFQKIDEPHSLSISETTDSQRLAYMNI